MIGSGDAMMDCGTLGKNVDLYGVRKAAQDELVLVASWGVKIAGGLVQMQIEEKREKVSRS
jgi:hypothetical protein